MISNVSKIKALERIVKYRDEEILSLKVALRKKEFQYTEMKKRATVFKQQAVNNRSTHMMSTMPMGMGMPWFNQAPFMQSSAMPRLPQSVSNESIVCDHVK